MILTHGSTTVVEGSTTVVTKTDTKSISVTKIYTTTVSSLPSCLPLPPNSPQLTSSSSGSHPRLQHRRGRHHRRSHRRRQPDRLRVLHLRRHAEWHRVHDQVAAADDRPCHHHLHHLRTPDYGHHQLRVIRGDCRCELAAGYSCCCVFGWAVWTDGSCLKLEQTTNG